MTESDELSDRAAGWAKRDSEPDEPSEPSERSEPSDSSEPSDLSMSSDTSDSSEPSDSSGSSDSSDLAESVRQPDNVKEAWEGNYYYLPPDISSQLEEEMDRLQYECRELNVKKNRHFNVVMVVDGLDALQEMSGEEFRDRLEELRLI